MLQQLTRANLISVHFTGNDTGYIAGNDGVLLKTVDGGTVINIKKNHINLETAEDFSLMQNYPNPFNQSSIISFQCPTGGLIQLKIYDVMGREVRTLVDEELQSGTYSVRFDAGDLPSGVYFYQLRIEALAGRTNNFTDTKKMLLLK
jgi:hypothetical protein